MLKARVITAVVLLVFLLGILAFRSTPLFVAAATLFFGAATWESYRLFGNRQAVFGGVMWAAAFVFLAWQNTFSQAPVLYVICGLIFLLRLAPSLKLGLPPLEGLRNRMLGFTYGIAILGCFGAIVVLFQRSPVYLVSAMAIVWVADIGAYFAGKAFGKHKLAPSISPGKSWEGAIGGWIAVLVLAAAAAVTPQLSGTYPAHLLARAGWGGFLFAMTVLVAASVVGDLFESQLKRRIGMKDSSNLLPGHGGVLDRIDALIPALPLAVLFDTWM